MESPDFSEASCLSSLLSLIAPGANSNKKIEILHLLVPGNRNHPPLCVGVWGQPDQLHKDSLIYSPEQSWSNSTGREREQPADTGNCQEQPNLSGLNPSFSNSNIQMLKSTSLCTTLTSTIIQISLFSPKLEGNRDENKIKQVKHIYKIRFLNSHPFEALYFSPGQAGRPFVGANRCKEDCRRYQRTWRLCSNSGLFMRGKKSRKVLVEKAGNRGHDVFSYLRNLGADITGKFLTAIPADIPPKDPDRGKHSQCLI